MFRTICLLLVVLLGFTFGVQADDPIEGTEPAKGKVGKKQTVTIKSSKAQRQELLGMWTYEARTAAEPMPMPIVSPDVATIGREVEAQGEPGFAVGGIPDPEANLLAPGQFPEEWARVQEALDESLAGAMLAEPSLASESYGTAGVFDTWMGNKWGQFWFKYPRVAVGKLYIQGGGYCSASVISPNNIIVTAAHCVYDYSAQSWYPGWTFVPADRKGTAPYGTFPWASATVLTNWQTTGQVRYDVALIVLGNNAAGNPVTAYTGWLGRSWDWGYVQHHLDTGYPSNLSGGGQWTHICAAESWQDSTDVLGMGCDMTFGCSGGPWIKDYEYWLAGAMNYVNSVNSVTDLNNNLYGPRFSSNNIVILCTAVGC